MGRGEVFFKITHRWPCGLVSDSDFFSFFLLVTFSRWQLLSLYFFGLGRREEWFHTIKNVSYKEWFVCSQSCVVTLWIIGFAEPVFFSFLTTAFLSSSLLLSDNGGGNEASISMWVGLFRVYSTRPLASSLATIASSRTITNSHCFHAQCSLLVSFWNNTELDSNTVAHLCRCHWLFSSERCIFW